MQILPKQRYLALKQEIKDIALQCGRDPYTITLIAVSKGRPIDDLLFVYEAGCRDFGESRVQEALKKVPLLPSDTVMHFIGTLQSNKISSVLDWFTLIHSVDSLDLAKNIDQACQKRQVVLPVLLQVNMSGEASKHGLNAEEWRRGLEDINQLSHIEVRGLMTMAPLTEDVGIIRACFRGLKDLQEEFKQRIRDPQGFKELSMGMSHDYHIAIEEGATLLRIGSAIFEQD